MTVATRPSQFIAAAMLMSAATHAEVLSSYYVNSVTITDLGTLASGAHSDANDINDAGNIVGWSTTAFGADHAFFYSGGSMGDIGAAYAYGTFSEARALNNSNVVVGYHYDSANGFQAFYWSASSGLLDLVDSYQSFWWPPLPEFESSAESISDTGAVAGWRSEVGGNPQIATVWPQPYSVFYSLEPDPWGVGSYASAINSSGLVVGHGTGNGSHRWQFTPGTYPSPRVSVPGTVGGTGVTVRGINSWGGIVGFDAHHPDPANVYSYTLHASYWDGVAPFARNLGLLPTGTRSIAEDINDAGFIAGYADQRVATASGYYDTPYSAFIHHSDFGIYVLPKLPTSAANAQCHARALNNLTSNLRVQIVGSCETGGIYSPAHAVRWDVYLGRRRPFSPKTP